MGAWDYFVRDYQQNVRVILTETTHQSSSTASMEATRATTEDGVFGQLGSGNEVEATRTNTPTRLERQYQWSCQRARQSGRP